MKRLLLLFLLSLISITALAVDVPAKIYFTTTGSTTYDPLNAGVFFSTPDLACRNYYDRVQSLANTYISHNIAGSTNTAAGTCYVKLLPHSSSTQGTVNTPINIAITCPAGSSRVNDPTNFYNTKCSYTTCPAGTTANSSGRCIDNCDQYKGQSASLDVNCSSTNAPSLACMPNNCVAQLTGSATGFDKAKSCYFGYAYGKYNGQTCNGQPNSTNFSNPTSAPVQPAPSPETDCIKQGKSFGTVNGVAVCVPKTSGGATPVKDTTETTTTTTTTDTAGNVKTETKTQSQESTKNGDEVTTKTTTSNPDGTKKEESKVESFTDFCTSNPNHHLCKSDKPEEEGGIDCEENPELPACMTAGTPVDNELITGETRTVSFAPVSITSGGSCPPDKTVSAAGRTMTFSYSWICQYAEMFKPFMLAFAYLSAGMFLFWGFKGAQS